MGGPKRLQCQALSDFRRQTSVRTGAVFHTESRGGLAPPDPWSDWLTVGGRGQSAWASTRHPTPHPQPSSLNTQHPILNPQHSTPNTQPLTLNTQHPTPNTQSSTVSRARGHLRVELRGVHGGHGSGARPGRLPGRLLFVFITREPRME